MRKIVWTTEQEQFLKDNINCMTVNELGVHCGHSSVSATNHKIRRLGLKKRVAWTIAQEQFLKEHINDMSVKELGMQCGHPGIQAMKHRIRKLGLKKIRTHEYRDTWTAEQKQLLRENINAMPVRELGLLCNHPNDSTMWREIKKLGLKKDVKTYDYRNKFPKTWTDEQEQFLREHKDDMTLRELGTHCGNRSTHMVGIKLNGMGLKKHSFARSTQFKNGSGGNAEYNTKKLSCEDVSSVYPRYPMSIACKKLNISVNTLSRKITRLGIERKTAGYYHKGKSKPYARERMNRLWRTGYFASKFYPFAAPNKAEDRLLAVIQELGLPFRYVGDWKYQVGTLNPDFVHMSKPVCIDLFGTYWHSDKNKHAKSRASYISAGVRTQEFEANGHKLLVIYEKELRDLEALRNKLVAYAEM